MKYLFVILAFLWISPAQADNIVLQKAENWLRGLDQAQSKFEQIAHDGSSIRGTFYIHRPGRLRFEYDAPIQDYIVADGIQIHFYDGDSGQVNSGPIGATLADFILREDIDFDDGAITVDSIMQDENHISMTLYQTDQQGMGTLTLNFSAEPFALQSWTIKDAQGFTTSIILRDFNRTVGLSPSLFRMDQFNFNE